MEFAREEPVKVRFVIPDKITVRLQMAYYSEATGVIRQNHFERLWYGARAIMQEWECELFDKNINLDEVDDPRITEIIVWASAQVKVYINNLEAIPKN